MSLMQKPPAALPQQSLLVPIFDATTLHHQLTLFLSGTLKGTAFKQLEVSINNYTKTRQCWLAILQLIDCHTRDNKALRVLASNILKDKFKFDFGQLGADFASVHNAVLKIIASLPNAQTPVRNNLCLCIVYTYMHKYQVLGDLLQYLKTNFDKPELMPYIFSILAMLPEEIDNYKVVIEEERRRQLETYMKQNLQLRVLIELNTVATAHWQSDVIRKTTLLECLSNWVQLKDDPQVLASLPGHFVLNAALNSLADPELSDESVDTIIQVLRCMQDPQRDKQLFAFFVRHMVVICSAARKMIEQQADEERIEPLVRAVCQFARKAISQFTSSPTEESNKFLEDIVFLSSQRDAQYIEQAIKFWVKFCSTIVKDNLKEAGIYYQALLKNLFINCSHLIEFTVSEATDLNTKTTKSLQNMSAKFENRMHTREQLEELFELIGEIVGYQKCVDYSLSVISSLDMEAKSFWCRFESLLYPLTQLASELRSELPSQVLTGAVVRMTKLEPPYKCVEKVIMEFLSECSDAYCNDNATTLLIFNYVIARIKDSRIGTTASKVFENICENNSKFVTSNIDTFMELFAGISSNEKILLGIVSAIVLENDVLNKYLPKLFRPYVETIIQLMSAHNTEAFTMATKSQVKNSIEKIKLMIENLSQSQGQKGQKIVVQVFKSIWPSLKAEVANPDEYKQYDFLERICKLVKCTMRCLEKEFWPFMEEVFSTILQAYQYHPIGSYIYAVEVAVTVFYKYPQFHSPMQIIYEKACDLTFVHFEKLEHIEDNPDLANDFFGMNVRFLRYNQATILGSTKLSGILKLVTIACGVENKDIAKPLYAFVQRLYMLYWPKHLIDQYNNTVGTTEELRINNSPEISHLVKELEGTIINNTGFMFERIMSHLQLAPSSSIRENILDAFMAEIKAFPGANQKIWAPILAKLSHDILTEAEKNSLISRLGELTSENMKVLDDLLYRISRRFMNRKMRCPLS